MCRFIVSIRRYYKAPYKREKKLCQCPASFTVSESKGYVFEYLNLCKTLK